MAGVYILVGVGGFPRTALSRRLWGIPNDLTARCLSNLLIVEPVVLISPLHHKTKTDHSVGLCFGGSGWIRTTSGLSQQIYSLPRLSNSGARPISIPPAFANGFGGQWIFSPCFAAVKILGAGSGKPRV